MEDTNQTDQDSILISIKKLLGFTPDYKVFDTDIIIHINTVFTNLNQIGVGPEEGFSIQDDKAVWTDFIKDNKKLNSVITYVYLKVKLIFDPPLSSSVMEAFKQTIDELEWRLNVEAETSK